MENNCQMFGLNKMFKFLFVLKRSGSVTLCMGELSLYFCPYFFPPGNISKCTAATLQSSTCHPPDTHSPLFDFYLTSICIKICQLVQIKAR